MYACVLYTFKFTNENETAECFFFSFDYEALSGEKFSDKVCALGHTHTHCRELTNSRRQNPRRLLLTDRNIKLVTFRLQKKLNKFTEAAVMELHVTTYSFARS